MSVTYYVALPFIQGEEGLVPGKPQELPNETSAIIRAEGMARKPPHVGALAFKRTGEPGEGNYGDATVSRKFGRAGEFGPALNPPS